MNPIAKTNRIQLILASMMMGLILLWSTSASAECPRAVELRQEGALEEAERIARACVEARPDNADDLLELATILGARGDYDEAERVLDRAAEAAPDYHAVDLQRARNLAWRGDYRAALQQLHELPDATFEAPEARLLRGRVNLWSDNFDDAVDDLEAACEEGISAACDLAVEARREASPPFLSSVYAQGEYSLVQDREAGWSVLGQLTFEPLRDWTISPSAEIRTRPFPDTSLTDFILKLDTRLRITGPLELAAGGGWAPDATFFPDWNAYIEPHLNFGQVDVGIRYWHIQFDDAGVDVVNPILTLYLGKWYVDGRYYLAIESDEMTHAGLARLGYSIGDVTLVAGGGAGNRSDFVELRRGESETEYHWLALAKGIWAFHPRQRASLEVIQRVDRAGDRDYIQTQFLLGYQFLF